MGTKQQADILIVDDVHANLNLLSEILEGHNFTVRPAPNGQVAIASAQKNPPDLILLDINMPKLNGFDVCQSLKDDKRTCEVPILFVSALGESFNKVKAFEIGAEDYITKPFNVGEVIARINHHLSLSRLQKQLLEKNESLSKEIIARKAVEAEVKKLNTELEQLAQQRQEEMLERLAIVGEKRDDDTGEHTFRVGNLSANIAEEIGLRESEITMLRQAARLHDIGKVAVPDSVLLKPGKLTKEEFDVIKRHTVVGAEMLAQSSTPLLRMAEKIALSHHERWDGRGYPQKLSGDIIPIFARIVTVADVFDALTSERPYKKAWAAEDAITEIKRCTGSQFDPNVVDGFLKVISRNETLAFKKKQVPLLV